MKVICPVCQKTAQDGNLWCDRPNCPAGNMPPLMDYGDHFGNNQIVQVRRVMRTATLYDAESEGRPVLLKVAHRGQGGYLQTELNVLKTLSHKADEKKVFPATALPRLLEDGTCVFRGEVFRYAKFEAISGDVLSDKLLHHPEPWYKHVGWFIQHLGATLRRFHNAGYMHGALSSDGVLVHQDKMGVWLPVLLDMGTGKSLTEANKVEDLYRLGLLLYNMLEIRPPTSQSLRLTRTDIPQMFGVLVEEWGSRRPNKDDPYGQKRLRKELGPRPEFVPRWQFWKHTPQRTKRKGRRQRLRGAALPALVILLVLIVLLLLIT